MWTEGVNPTAAIMSAGIRPDIRHNRCRRQTTIPELAEIFEVGKYGQIFVANIAVERAIEIFAVGGSDFRSQIGEVKERAFASNPGGAGVLRVSKLVGGGMRSRKF